MSDGVLMLCRPGRGRMDISARTVLPPARNMSRLAHQIRQDIWRGLKGLRGFSPVVKIAPSGEIFAGGQVSGPVAPKHRASLQTILDCPRNRTRWLKCAGEKS